MPHQHITGLNPQQFATLLTALNNYLTWRKPDTKPRRLTLTQALKITLLYHRYNLTEDFLAYIFSISQPTVSRTINLIEKTLDKVLQPVVQPLEKALEVPGSLVIDGTLIPTWNWRSQGKTNFSGKHKKAGFNHQIICTIDGKLLAITDSLPGARHDAYAFRVHGLERYLDDTTLADKGYVGLGLLTPVKRRSGVKMPKAVKDNNRVINGLRSVVERVIGNIKTWRVLHTGFRRPLDVYGRVFAVVRGLIFFAAGYPL